MIKHFDIPTENGNYIHANFFEAQNPKKLLIICSTIGVNQEFYHDISRYFQENGITVSTFDYSGIGYSLKVDIKKVKSSLIDWANDLAAVINYNAKIYPNIPITIMGHGLSGQLIGLTKHSLIAQKIVLIAAQNEFWGYLDGVSKIKMWFNLNLLYPFLIKIFGYLPSRKSSNMENLPKNVADEWKKWRKNKNYLFAYIDAENLFFRKFKCELISYNLAFDESTPQKSIDKLTDRYSNAKVKKVCLYPETLNMYQISHFELFDPKSKFTIWNKLRAEI